MTPDFNFELSIDQAQLAVCCAQHDLRTRPDPDLSVSQRAERYLALSDAFSLLFLINNDAALKAAVLAKLKPFVTARQSSREGEHARFIASIDPAAGNQPAATKTSGEANRR